MCTDSCYFAEFYSQKISFKKEGKNSETNASSLHKEDTHVVLFPLYCGFDSPSPFPSDFL